MGILVRGGTVVTAAGVQEADVLVQGERIAQIGVGIDPGPDNEILDASGKLVLPGAIDTHVHFELPFCGTVSKDDFAGGSQAAACGGVTTFIDFATQSPGQTLTECIEERKAQADDRVCIDYALHATITDWSDRIRSEMRSVIQGGVPSFKMYMIYKDEGWMASDSDLFFALQEARKWGGMIGVHAENVELVTALANQALHDGTWRSEGAYAHFLSRPAFTEAEAVQRAIALAQYGGGVLYVAHTSSRLGIQEIRQAKALGLRVYAETCPQYLLLDATLLKNSVNGHLYGTCPPVRTTEDRLALWHALSHGVIDFMGTDTCTFDTKQKEMWEGDFSKIPFGLPGIETFLPLMFSEGYLKGRLTLEQLVAVTSTHAARIFGLYPRKGSISIGADADLVIIDSEREVVIDWEKLRTNCDWSPYQGMTVTGWPEVTLCRGKVVAKEGAFVGNVGWGRFIPGSSCKRTGNTFVQAVFREEGLQ